MIIFGIDPGLAHTGYGIIEIKKRKMYLISQGVVATLPSLSPGERLERIYGVVTDLIDRFQPHQAGVESLYFAKNSTSAIPVAQARGVVLLACTQRGVPASEYPPQAIKQAIVGNGRAEKAQVQELVRMILCLKDVPQSDHASDALAVAICHYHMLEASNSIAYGKGNV
jgi:crossover junction endodeoxyribonuclease RuvC